MTINAIFHSIRAISSIQDGIKGEIILPLIKLLEDENIWYSINKSTRTLLPEEEEWWNQLSTTDVSVFNEEHGFQGEINSSCLALQCELLGEKNKSIPAYFIVGFVLSQIDYWDKRWGFIIDTPNRAAMINYLAS